MMKLDVQNKDKGGGICANKMEHVEVSVSINFEFILELR